MNKLIIPLLSLFLLFTSCGESEVEMQTAAIIVAQNNAIADYTTMIRDAYALNMAGAMDKNAPWWRQKGWDDQKIKYQIDNLVKDFEKKFGVDETNILRIKLDDNFTVKMKGI